MGLKLKKHGVAACLAAGMVAGGASAVRAQDEVDSFAGPGSRVSGTLSFDYYTHFVLYGYDVWDGGDSWGDGTFNPMISVNIALTDNMNVFTGAWADVNDNAPSAIGGELQEVDSWLGVDYTIDKFTFSVTYQYWNYSSTTEHVLDFGIAFDDSEYLGDWAMNPSLTIHRTSDAQNGGGDEGWAYVFGFGPGFTFNEGGDYPVSLSIPVKIGFGDGDFYYDSGFAFASIGAQVSIPLSFIDESYGSWSFNAGLTYYLTDDDAIPQDALYLGDNPDDNYLVGNIGVALAF